MNMLLFFILILIPFSASAYVGPAIAGIFGSAIGLGGIIVISLVFMFAWPLAKLFLMMKKKKKNNNSDKSDDES